MPALPGTDRCRVLLLAPSNGLGGGIERYLWTIEECLRGGGGDVHRLDMRRPGRDTFPVPRARFVIGALAAARGQWRPDVVVAGHPNLIPVAAAVARLTVARRAFVVCYGDDIWAMRRRDRALLHRDAALVPVAISSYGAGVLAATSQGPIIRPGLAPSWRAELLAQGARRSASATPGGTSGVPTLLTAFRLAAWEGKGLPVLLDALTTVRRALGAVRLVVAGHGPAPEDMLTLIRAHEDVIVHETPGDADLARLYAAADLFVLCTRTRPRPPYGGEGYGMVLLEAQLAGCPVVGPARGGSGDAYQDGLTGVTPRDESAEALSAVLIDLLADGPRLARLGRQAAEWAEATTRPQDYTGRVFSTLTGRELGGGAQHPRIPVQRTAAEQPRDFAGADPRSSR
ncbi:glycosyltransferase family 4 protein [Parafrankia discariae]|uniref:glycosyltransferase family 4 protein n=1 Tax=Parafrankia discariae TaxID=365528 RepID=UPI001E58C097|nr:glycosyltransferase family 4 protein [Parafrankia discariae]